MTRSGKKTSSFRVSTVWYNQIMGATASRSSPQHWVCTRLEIRPDKYVYIYRSYIMHQAYNTHLYSSRFVRSDNSCRNHLGGAVLTSLKPGGLRAIGVWEAEASLLIKGELSGSMLGGFRGTGTGYWNPTIFMMSSLLSLVVMTTTSVTIDDTFGIMINLLSKFLGENQEWTSKHSFCLSNFVQRTNGRLPLSKQKHSAN